MGLVQICQVQVECDFRPKFFLNHTYLSLIGGLVPLKVWVSWLRSGKNCLGLRKNYYRLARVLQKIAPVRLAKTPTGWVLTQPIPIRHL